MGLWWLRYVPTIAVTAMLGLAVAYGIHRAKEQVRAELEPKIEKLEADLAAERADRARAEAASDAYRSEVDALRNRPVSRSPVRLCNETRAAPAEPAAQGTDGSATTTSGGNELARSDFAQGPDIGPDLYALAQMCDSEFAKLRALQQWIRNDVR
jgi:hypothetical protein